MNITRALLLTLALAPAPAAAISSPAPSPPVIVVSGWRLECTAGAYGDIACQALDRVSMRSNSAVVGAISVRLSTDKKFPIVFVQVPLGIAVPNAVRVGTASGALQTIAILTCNRDGCFGNARLGEPLLNAMRAAKEPLHLAYDTLTANAITRTITVDMGLDGFASTYDKLR